MALIDIIQLIIELFLKSTKNHFDRAITQVFALRANNFYYRPQNR